MQFQYYLEHLQQEGILSFTLQDAKTATGKSRGHLLNSVHQYQQKGALISPLKGFYIIVPLVHRALGSLPPHELVVTAMNHLKVPYYAGLLTAAAYHGATHQRLQIFQVVSSKRMYRDWVFGGVTIKFIYKHDIGHTKIEKRTVEAGYLPISTPEETAKDIMIYYTQSGGLNHQATVLSELIDAIDIRKLIALAEKTKGTFWLQRIGYILSKIDPFNDQKRDKVVKAIGEFLGKTPHRYIPLAPELPTQGKPRFRAWKIIINTTVESDI